MLGDVRLSMTQKTSPASSMNMNGAELIVAAIGAGAEGTEAEGAEAEGAEAEGAEAEGAEVDGAKAEGAGSRTLAGVQWTSLTLLHK
jgi:hypothetical protein